MMDRYSAGMLARSLAGHDTGKLYIILRSEGQYVYLADGKIRTVDRPKKKKKKHVQPVCTQCGAAGMEDAAVRRILKTYLKQEKGKQEE